MLTARVPLRLTIGGGGSDTEPYVSQHGGFAITAAISKHVYVSLNQTFQSDYFCRYSETERADNISSIAHPIIREALRYYEVPPGIEIVSMADIPSGTGLGSSGAFTVALCMALSAYIGQPAEQTQAALDASHIELEILERPGGKQDHWATAMGGVRAIKFAKTGQVYSAAVDAPDKAIADLDDALRLYYTGTRRDADDVLSTQTTEGLDEIKHLGYQVHHRIVAGDIASLGQMMNLHWALKRQRSKEISNPAIDTAYKVALDNGAIGGKLVGAGGGGFLAFIATDGAMLTDAMTKIGMPEVPFSFDHIGATIIAA